jgi:hypothetical protein
MHYACDLNLVLVIGRLVKNEITNIYSHKRNTILSNTVHAYCFIYLIIFVERKYIFYCWPNFMLLLNLAMSHKTDKGLPSHRSLSFLDEL